MDFSTLKPGQVVPLFHQSQYCPDPLTFFAQNRKDYSLLLESNENGSQSLAILEAALLIECRGNVVVLKPQSTNGQSLVGWLREQYPDHELNETTNECILHFKKANELHREEDRLNAQTPIDVLRSLANKIELFKNPIAMSWLVAGAFAYDFVDIYEQLPQPKEDELEFPDFIFMVPEVMLHLDHKRQVSHIICPVVGGDLSLEAYHDAMAKLQQIKDVLAQPVSWQAAAMPKVNVEIDLSDEQYKAVVAKAKEHIHAGDVFQIVPSRTFSLPCSDPLSAYSRLKKSNPSPYMFYLSLGSTIVFGASPETAIKVDGDPKEVLITPIAGTRKRSSDRDQDGRLQLDMMLNEKELAEHMMLIDLARNDVARVSQVGTRSVPEILIVEKYSHVMHLVSRVIGQLKHGYDACHAYIAAMNMGTLVGAPKIRAAEILRDLEATKRGTYGGAIGYFNSQGDMDTAIMIRSAIVKEGIAYVRAGAGIVYDSDPQSEADETRQKAKAAILAIGGTI